MEKLFLAFVSSIFATPLMLDASFGNAGSVPAVSDVVSVCIETETAAATTAAAVRPATV